MKVTKNSSDLTVLNVEMSREELEEGILMTIMKNSDYTFLPYKIVDYLNTTQIPGELFFKLKLIPRE